MAEIKLSVEALENSIQDLNSLKQACSIYIPVVPEVIGGGQTVNQLEQIAEMYKTLNADLSTLVCNTISLMENAKQSYVSTDNMASSKIKGN